jgi:hypothetical protein
MSDKNAFIVGCGSKFGADLLDSLQTQGFTVYGISGSEINNPNILTVDWQTCGIADIEKFLRGLPVLDLIIFNQNSPALTDDCINLTSNISIMEVWRRSEQWKQSHYINCVLPLHCLHTLNNKLTNNSIILWVLSFSMFTIDAPTDYIGQKYQNYITMKQFAKINSQIYLGICPGTLVDDNREKKSMTVVNFLINNITHDDSGKFYYIDQLKIIEHNNIISYNI